MHFELERQLRRRERADLERRVRAILHDVRLVVRDFEPMQERVRHMIELSRQAAVRYCAAGGRRGGRLPRVAPAAELRAARVPRVRTARHRARPVRSARCPGAGSGSSPTSPRRGFADADAARDSLPDIRARASRTGTCSCSRRRAPTRPCTGGRGWTTSGSAGSAADGEIRRRGEADRAVHVEGVHGAGEQDTAAPPQARADPGRRGPDPRLARLQGGRRAVRVVPQGRAVPGLDRGTAPARRGAPAAREARRHPGARPQGPLRPAGHGRRGAPAREVQRRPPQAPAADVPRAVPRAHGRLQPVARRDGVGTHLLHRPRRSGRADPRGAVRAARGRGRAAGPHLGRRPAGRA